MLRYAHCLLMLGLPMVGLSGCGGGSGGGSSSSSSSSISSSSSSSVPTLSERSTAATNTAHNNSACTTIQPFYWEIGDHSGALVGNAEGDGSVTSNTTMKIASASKWIFGSYVVQLRQSQNVALSDADIKALTMRTGHTHFDYNACIKLVTVNQNAESVDECFTNAHTLANNDLNVDGFSNNDLDQNPADYDQNSVPKFYYNGGHFQYLATQLGLGPDNNAALHSHVAAQVGSDFTFTYDSPQMAAGVNTTAADYAFFLRKILNNQLAISGMLGSHAVCTNPVACPNAAAYTPIPSTEVWHYSLAHWVEDDPSMGDGAFSSPGAFGFYPWIDASKTYYGVLARYATISFSVNDPVSVQSVLCGRTIRKAWLTGMEQ